MDDMPGTLVIPEGEKLIHRSELFEVVVRSKHRSRGLFRDRFMVAVELVEGDPLLQRVAVLDIAEDVWRQLEAGERAQARLYEQADRSWTTLPPRGEP
jgi:hypothetical protein